MKKRILSVLLAVMMVLTLMPTAALADTTATSGTRGKDLTWEFYNGTLTISGTGAMKNYGRLSDGAPWAMSGNVTSVVIEPGVTTIGSYAFYCCRNLKNVSIPNSVTKIGDHAFYGCSSLESVSLPYGVTVIAEGTFTRCISLENISLPNGLKSIGDSAFLECNTLKSIELPNSVMTIGIGAFRDCSSLERVTLPDSLTTIDGDAFEGCSSLESVTIPAGITDISTGVFNDCSSLESVSIPDSVTYIGYNAFGDCVSLTDVYYGGTQKQWNRISISDSNKLMLNATIHYNSYHSHNYMTTVVAPTCAEQGYTLHKCSCGASYKDTYVAAPGHTLELQNFKATTCTTAGYSGDKYCTVCKQTVEKGKEVKALGHNYVGGVCYTCGAKDPNYVPSKVSFTDVSTADYCYDAVQWAVANGITNGTGNNTFSPDKSCSRAEVVTFLWRAAGEPSASATVNFTDVKPTDYFYKAVQWAVENKITTGAGNNMFLPNDTCTRSQVVTFLWRANGSPIVSGGGFADVASSAYYCDAVSWAVSEKITTGTGNGQFSPDALCTRGQVVTFLFRAK